MVNCENIVQKKIWPFNILLIVNNALGSPTVIQELGEHIKEDIIPPDSTSLIQPMDEGAMSTYKAFYLEKTFNMLVKTVDSKTLLKEMGKVSLLEIQLYLLVKSGLQLHVCVCMEFGGKMLLSGADSLGFM